MKFLKTASLVLAASVALGACSEGDVSNFSPEQVIENALEQTEKAPSYYGEATMDMGDVKLTLKEWTDGKNRRVEVSSDEGEALSVFKDGVMTTYDKTNNKVITIDTGDTMGNLPSPQETAENILHVIKDTHDVKMVGEEKVAGRATYHIQAIEKKETLFGNQDFWVDKETWVILKAESQMGDAVSKTVYTKFDTKPKLAADTFELAIPKDATVEVIDTDTNEVAITEEQAKALYPELRTAKGVEVTSISKMDGLKGEPEITFEYQQDGHDFVSVSLFKDTLTEEETKLEKGEDQVEVLGEQATYEKMGDFQLLNFAKDGLRYSIMPTGDGITKEQLIDFANKLEK